MCFPNYNTFEKIMEICRYIIYYFVYELLGLVSYILFFSSYFRRLSIDPSLVKTIKSLCRKLGY